MESDSSQVRAFIKELGVGATFTSPELAKRLPHLASGAVSGALDRLIKDEYLKSDHNRPARLTVAAVDWKFTERAKPKPYTRSGGSQGPRGPCKNRKRASPAEIVIEIHDRLAALEAHIAQGLSTYTDLQLMQELTKRHGG